jgi:DNA polymerase-3 subunit alpha
MEDLETIGLLKMDFLGLRTLTVLQQTIELVKASSGGDIDLSALPEDDPKTMELLCAGETLGIFQLESAGMRRLLMQLAPESFTDLIPLVALYRPGPLGSGMVEDFIRRRHGEKEITYLHPALEEILRPTYGIILYQEQVMQICSRLGGFSLGEADLVRRAMGKKKPEVLAAMRRKFLDGAAANGISRQIGEEVFDLMEHFAGYGFNKSHSAAYALIAYWTAFLKANYPQAFMAALLTSVIGNSDKVGVYIEECRRLNIPVYPPDVNHSSSRFTVEDRGIRFGLLAVKNLGAGVIHAMEKEREKAVYTSVYDFCRRLDNGTINKRVVESLIKAGAFTSTGRSRRELLDVYEHACDQALQRSAFQRGGQLSFFDLEEEFATTGEEKWTGAEEFPLETILALEKEYLGVYLSGHPIDPWREKFRENQIPTLAQILEEGKEGKTATETVLAGGVVSRWRRINTKAGKTMASFILEDPTGSIEVLVFPNLYERVAVEADNDRVVVVKGRLDAAEEGEKLLAQQIRWL